MARNRRQPSPADDDYSLIGRTLAAVGDAITRNPLAVGGSTAFLVTLSYVSANALWYQPHFHDGAFFSTRHGLHYHAPAFAGGHDAGPAAAPVRAPRPQPQPSQAPKPATAAAAASEQHADPMVLAVQAALSDRKLYAGPVDGIPGPQTHKAIQDYQTSAGLNPSGEIDTALLARLKLGGETVPASAPEPTARPVIDASLTQSVSNGREALSTRERNIRVQAGLRAFGNNAIKLDGVIGAQTEAAIREFQSLFGLPVTGKADDTLLAKMREEGFTN